MTANADFNMSRDDIIRAALRKIGALGEGEIPSAQTMSDAAQALNVMVKYWQAKAPNLWTLEEGVLFLSYGQQAYPLGPGSASKACLASSLIETTLTSAALAGDGDIAVTAATGLVAGVIIGVMLSTGAIHWTTVSGAPTGLSVPLTAPLAGAADLGAGVYAYSSATGSVGRPVGAQGVPSARRRLLSVGSDIPLQMCVRDQYMNLPVKSSLGSATQYYYDPQQGQGMLYLWPVAAGGQEQLRFTFRRSILDFDNISDLPDYPAEWLQALIYGLADELQPEFGVIEAKVVDKIQLKAVQAFNDLSGADTDVALYIRPGRR